MQQRCDLAISIFGLVKGDGRGPVECHGGQVGDDGVARGHAIGAHVHEEGVVHGLDLLHLEAAYLSHDRDGEGLVLRVQHQRFLDLDAVAGQHFAQAVFQRLQRQSAGELIKADAVVAGGHHDRAAAHQVLVNGEALLVGQALRGDDRQHVHVRRHLPAAQVYVAHLVLLAQGRAQLLPTGQRRLRLPEHILRRLGRRRPQSHHLEEAR